MIPGPDSCFYVPRTGTGILGASVQSRESRIMRLWFRGTEQSGSLYDVFIVGIVVSSVPENGSGRGGYTRLGDWSFQARDRVLAWLPFLLDDQLKVRATFAT
jgi:hypothetical protein